MSCVPRCPTEGTGMSPQNRTTDPTILLFQNMAPYNYYILVNTFFKEIKVLCTKKNTKIIIYLYLCSKNTAFSRNKIRLQCYYAYNVSTRSDFKYKDIYGQKKF